MQYREMKQGMQSSILGYGCMRFSTNGAKIDIDKAEKEVMSAIEKGVNYFDTAYIYPGSEEALGEILKRNNCREKVMIATKLPQYLVNSRKALDRFFEEQLSHLQTDYVDFYLMHMLPDTGAWEKLVKLGVKEWIAEKKKSGQIRNIGFSFHGDSDTFIALVDAYDWDFCQIQYNYLDEDAQAGKKGLLYAAEKQIPVVIMEPLRGGRLVTYLPDSAKEMIANHPSGRSAAEWAFRWLWNQPEVTCVLSGMNSMEMVEENCRVASDSLTESFSEEDFAFIEQIKNEINRCMKVGCTGCGYCMPCPKGVDIPTAFRCYNQMFLEKKKSVRLEYQQITSMLKKDVTDMTKCVNCGACEKHCPQHLEIRKELKNAQKALQPLYIRIMNKAMRLLVR